MENIINLITPSAKYLRGYAEKLLAGVTAAQFARKASPAGVALEINHPAFNIGHLGLYPALVVELLGGDNSALRPPAGFQELFKNGIACQDDPKGEIYPAMEIITRHYFESHDKLTGVLEKLPPEAFFKPLSGDRATRFPTAGAFVTFILGGHAGIHLGQISAWRRCMGMKAA